MTEPAPSEADEKAPENDETAPESAEEPEQAPEGQPDPDEAAQQAPPPVTSEAQREPEDVATAAAETLGDKAVVATTPAGSLTLRPNQKDLDPAQVNALIAIGIDTKRDPQVLPQIRPFIHMCQIRGLDPWAREAYLIGRGKGDNRKFTMQTGIDGYRKMGAATGRFIRVKKRMWSGGDSDPETWVQIVDEDGDVVRKRVWWEQWPADKGYPGAAKVVIEHYDEQGGITTTAAVADWNMYAPYNDLWEYEPSKNKRVQRFDSNGKPVKVLSEMWQKGGAHMLAKCAEALAFRMAFPARMSGVYVTEEMHRLDEDERARLAREGDDKRRKAFEAAQAAAQGKAPEDEDIHEAEVVEDEPTPAAEAAAETVAEMKMDEADAQRLLLAELHWQAEVIGQKPESMARRRIAALHKTLDEFTAADLYPIVNGFRSVAVEAAQRQGLPEADAYAAVAVDGAGPIDVDALGPEDEGDAAPDPDALHEHVGDRDGPCEVCGLALNVGPHPEDEE